MKRLYPSVTRTVILACVAFCSTLAAPLAAEVKLDSYRVSRDTAPAGSTVRVRTFDASEADLGKQQKERHKEIARNMQLIAPIAFREALIQRLSESGAYASVAALDDDEANPEEGLLVEGRFTQLNPGSRTKRYMVGFGAGKARVCIEGRVLDAAGNELAVFNDCRSGTGMVSFVGGKAEGMMSNDVYKAAFNVADFLAQWAKGELPSGAKAKP